MPNVVKYQSGGSETHSIKKGNLWFGVGGRGYGPTDTTGFYSGIEIPDGGYAFYQGSAGGFTYYTANNDDQLVALVNSATGNSFDISESLHYIAQQDGMAVMKKNENQIVTDGLVLNLDASSLLSYPTTESKWYDLSKDNNNITLLNGAEFDNKSIIFDGTDTDAVVSFSEISSDSGSIEVIFEKKDNVANEFLFAKVGASTNRYYLRQTGTNMDAVRGNPLTSAQFDTPDLNKFTHLVMTWDKDTIYAYTNAQLNDSTSYTNPGTNISDGQLGGGPGGNIQMSLSKFKMYDKTLSLDEINQNYYGGPIVTDDLAFHFDPSNLVSYESGSTTAYSMTGSYTGTLINDVELDPQKGGVWKFDAVDTAISYGYQVINFNPSTQPFSMGGWMRLDSDSGSGNHAVIIDIGGTSSARLYIAIDKNDLRLVVNIRPPAGTTSVPVYTPENSVSFGEWVHGMVTFNGGTIKIYQNGELSRTATGFTNYPTATYNWWSGHQDDNNHYMDGFIGPVSLYLKTLSDDEVWQNYLAQSIRFE